MPIPVRLFASQLLAVMRSFLRRLRLVDLLWPQPPADYRVTSVKTFIVSYEGTVYEKDLGPDTLKKFKEMELYNPDKTWLATDDNW